MTSPPLFSVAVVAALALIPSPVLSDPEAIPASKRGFLSNMRECLSGGACRSPAHLTALGPGGFGMLAHKSRALESLQQSGEALSTTSSPLEYQPHSVTPPPPLFPPRSGRPDPTWKWHWINWRKRAVEAARRRARRRPGGKLGKHTSTIFRMRMRKRSREEEE